VTQGIALIVGLGNPGAEYAETRHNAGFRFIDSLREMAGATLRPESRFSGVVAKTNIASSPVWLLAPTTFMNRSGNSVAAFSRYFKIPPSEMLVAYDELDLPPGTVRLKFGGGDGGHNGLRDVIEKLGTADFYRLRIGIGHPGSASEVVSYVLKKAPTVERDKIDAAIDDVRKRIVDIVQGQMQQVMNVLHSRAS
jgi:PTH1 family peptidyl-tRNA hydrolase